jgi:hypothetical protein
MAVRFEGGARAAKSIDLKPERPARRPTLDKEVFLQVVTAACEAAHGKNIAPEEVARVICRAYEAKTTRH